MAKFAMFRLIWCEAPHRCRLDGALFEQLVGANLKLSGAVVAVVSDQGMRGAPNFGIQTAAGMALSKDWDLRRRIS